MSISHILLIANMVQFKGRPYLNVIMLYGYFAMMVVKWKISCTAWEDLAKNFGVHLLWRICRVIVNIIHNDINSLFHGNISEKNFDIEFGYDGFYSL